MKRTQAFLLGCLLIAVSTLSGCTGTAPDTGSVSVTLNEVAHSIFYAPQYVAIENGYFEENGISLTLDCGYGADKVMTALVSGNADIGLCGSEATIYAYAQGQDDYAVNFAQLTQRAGNFLVSKEPIQNFSWDMLKGTHILGGRAGGMPQMVLEYILKKHNINPETDLQIDQNIDFGLTAAAFTSGDAQFTVEFEPHATLLEQQGNGYIVASLGEASGYVPYTSYCAKKSFVESHPELIQHFTAAIQKGLDYVNSHTAEETAAVIAPQFPETDLKTITAIVDRYQKQDTWKTDTELSSEGFTLLQNILIEADQLKQKVNYNDLVITDFRQ